MILLFFLLFLLSGLLLVIGLIRPKIFKKITKVIPTRKMIALVFIGALVVSFVGMMFTVPPVDSSRISKQESSEITNQNIVPVDQANVTSDATSTDIVNQEVASNVANQGNITVPVNNQQATAPATQPSQPNQNTPVLYSVSSVVDGDTLKVNIDGAVKTIRLIGVNTPEVVDPRTTVQCFGKEASVQAKALLTGKKVRLESDSTQGELDKYGRLLRYIYLEDGTFFNKKMISDGYAYEYTYNTPYKYQSEFKAAQADAKKNLRGLWSPTACNGSLSMPAATTAATVANSPASSQTAAVTQVTLSSGKYYTSSYYNTKYYYPEACDGWKTLSANNLKSFSTLEALLKAYPSRTLSPQCK